MHRRNQKGRRRVESGQGSSGTGASTAWRFGIPGATGECMSLSSRCIPPDGMASMMKFAPFGVGTIGIAVGGVFRCLLVDAAELPSSDESMADAVSIFFKLDDEKFFLSVPGPAELLLVSRAGESGTDGTLSSLSAVVTLWRDGICGNPFDVVSADPDRGIGDDAFRSVLVLTIFAGASRTRLGALCCKVGIANADLGASVIVDVERGTDTEGSCVLGAAATGPSDKALALVSILSCGAPIPDSLLSRTPGLLFRTPGGGLAGFLTGLPFRMDIGRFGKAPAGGG